MRMMLANPPWTDPHKARAYGVRAGSRWPHFENEISQYIPFPFFLAYTAAVLEKSGVEIILRDSIAERDTQDDFLHLIQTNNPELLVIETSTPSVLCDLELCQTINKRFPQVKIVLCGPHYEMYAPEFLDNHAFLFALMLGEYEYTALELLNVMNAGGDLSNVSGLIFRDPSTGHVVQTPPRPLIEKLDELPFPARHLLRMERYCDPFGGIPTPSLQIIASRGCPFQCIFCSWPQIMYGSHRYRVRSAADILDEVEQCLERYRVKSLYFDDDTFNIGERRIIEICDEFIQRGIRLPWAVMARADTMTEPMLVKMKEAGIYAIKYGVESSNQEILNRTKKNLNLEKAERIVQLTKKLGIKVHLTFCFGLPGETKETINQTIDYSLSLDPESVQYSIVTPYPGSEYFEILEKEGRIVTKEWNEYDGSCRAVFETDSLSRIDLEKALTVAYLRWGMHSLRKNIFRRFFHFAALALRYPGKISRYVWKMIFAPKSV